MISVYRFFRRLGRSFRCFLQGRHGSAAQLNSIVFRHICIVGLCSLAVCDRNWGGGLAIVCR